METKEIKKREARDTRRARKERKVDANRMPVGFQ